MFGISKVGVGVACSKIFQRITFLKASSNMEDVSEDLDSVGSSHSMHSIEDKLEI
jgi:hypothetical protein